MTIENDSKLAWQFQRENDKAEPAPQTDALAEIPPSITDVSGQTDIIATPFLHEHEIIDAVRVVNLVAAGGGNPFTDERFEKLRPEDHNWVLQALCVRVSGISHPEQKPVRTPHLKSSSTVSPDPSSKPPLEGYLDRIEREATMKALAETNNVRPAAARLLGITFRALRYRLERLGMDE
jgi:hypothetical protein